MCRECAKGFVDGSLPNWKPLTFHPPLEQVADLKALNRSQRALMPLDLSKYARLRELAIADAHPAVVFTPAPIPAPASESARRKGMPLFAGCMMYFPDALLAIAEHSRKANDKHNPGEPLHWSRDKSKDHADCAARHLVDIGPNWDEIDPEFGSLHAVALAWRTLALLQTVLERRKK